MIILWLDYTLKVHSHSARRRASWCVMLCRKRRRNQSSFDFCVMRRTSTRVDVRYV